MNVFGNLAKICFSEEVGVILLGENLKSTEKEEMETLSIDNFFEEILKGSGDMEHELP